ncbi:oxygenase MpaB family protein [Actinoallomurus sp. NPDC052308]|uniref:oxygenase MpaB family protein n=1 Tax=Actinoallomurus sp. NPDC052308 TaxID=3155530 RepID=UPI003413DDD0
MSRFDPRTSIDEAFWAMMAAAHLPGEQYTGPPGDPGLFGPDSAIWHVHGDVSAVLGGVSGLILGTLNEPVTHGTNRFSDYLRDPIKRLGFTASFVLGMTYGSTPVAEAEDYFAATRPRLTVSEEVLQAVAFLRRPKGPTPATRISSALLARVATDLLPEWALALLGGRPPLSPATRVAGHALMRTLRYGVRYRMIDEARTRCAAGLADAA